MEKVIKVRNLVKNYGKLSAVDGVSFDVNRGEVFGLLGENGAGKTTTLEIIEGLRKSTSGEIVILGHNVKTEMQDIKMKIGVQLQSSAYYNYLSLKEILDLFASFYGCASNSKELLDMVELGFKEKSYVQDLSGGQKQRFSIVASLVNNPEIVFLDEPTTGLDPIARRNLWNLITKIKNQGKTIILTTHYMEEAELLCDRVAIMEQGKLLAIDETHKLIDKARYPYTITFITSGQVDKKTFEKIIQTGAEISNIFAKENQFEVKIASSKLVGEVLKLVQSLKPESITVGRATLEDVFVELTGRSIEE